MESNGNQPDKCLNQCRARTTRGECEQYHEWNRENITETIYDFDGTDNQCWWHPNPASMDDTVSSTEGQCFSKNKPCSLPYLEKHFVLIIMHRNTIPCVK